LLALAHQSLALFEQRGKLHLLFGDALGVAFLVSRAGIGRSLLL